MKLLLTITVLLFSITVSFAQKDLYNDIQKRKLTNLSEEISSQYKINYQKALKVARQKGWQTEGSFGNGKTFRLHGIDATGHPLYIATESNAAAAATTRTNQLYSGGSLGLSLNGNSSSVKDRLGIWDGGAPLATHQEFGTRIKQQDNTGGSDLHASHTSGTLIAAGISPQAKGMAFGANLKAWKFDNDVPEMTAAAPNLAISNHSYGFVAGWSYDETSKRWSWYGNTQISAFEDYKFGFYDSITQSWDKIANAAPYYLIVKSAGNNRGETGPGKGTYYFLGSSTTDSSNVVRSKNDGYDGLSTTSNAKNILTIGAVVGTNGIPPVQSSDIVISSFSSWGPTDDGRIKPDLVAVGVNVFSCSDASNTAYAVESGTSMSSPQTAGSILLLQELYASQNAGQLMHASTLKGLVLHTAQDAGNVGPDYIYGWGLLNMEKAGKILLNVDKTNSLTERNLKTGDNFIQKITASGKGPLTATISWTDPEGIASQVVPANLNNRTPKLVNDLDIRISDGLNNYLPFILNPDKPTDLAIQGDNIRDNVEQILIPDAVPGKNYTLSVSNKGMLKNNSQDYALIISGIGGTEYCASTPTTVQDDFGSVKLAGLSTGFKVFSSQKVALDLVLKGTASKTTNVYIDWNSDGIFDEATEKVATSEALTGTTFSTTFKASSGLLIGNSTLMRIVCVENSTAANVKGCGTYDKGITKDFTIQFVRPDVDLSVSNLISPDTVAFCPDSMRTVTVSIKNVGNITQQNIPVSVKISNKNSLVATLSGIYKDSLAYFAEGKLLLDGTFNAVSAVNYTFEVSINFPGDQDSTNNVKSFVRQVTIMAPPISAVAIICGGATNLTVNANQTNLVVWYDALVGGNLLYTGNTGSFIKPANITKVYAGLSPFSGSIGYKDKYALGGGNYSGNFGPNPIIVTQSPLLIESARVYIGSSGKITFSISSMSDPTPISSATFNVKATRTIANQTLNASGLLIDDPTDQGIVLPLNLTIPANGTYKLTQVCEGGASIYRSNLNVGSTTTGQDIKGYPFTIPNVISITGVLYNEKIIKTGYYYTYDMKVKSLGCPSARAEVPITTKAAPKAVVSPADVISVCQDLTKDLTANSGANYTYQWSKDGTPLIGETSAVYKVGLAGLYSITVTENGLCSATSPSITATIAAPNTPVIVAKNGLLLIQTGTNATWYLDGNVISGATQDTITPIKSGFYTVKATDRNGCEATSDGYPLTITAIDDEIISETISAKIFPNPASDKIRVEYRTPDHPKNVQADIINIFGITLTSKNLVKSNGVYTADFDVSKQNQGKFFVKIISDDSVKVVPLVIEN